MAASLLIEEESGTYARTSHHPHNGYYAGDFSRGTSSRDGFQRALLSVDSRRPSVT